MLFCRIPLLNTENACCWVVFDKYFSNASCVHEQALSSIQISPYSPEGLEILLVNNTSEHACPMWGAHKSFLCLTRTSRGQGVGKHQKTSAFHWCWASPCSWQWASHWSYCSLGAKCWHLCQVGQPKSAIKEQQAREEMKKENCRELIVHSSAWPQHLLIYILFFFFFLKNRTE